MISQLTIGEKNKAIDLPFLALLLLRGSGSCGTSFEWSSLQDSAELGVISFNPNTEEKKWFSSDITLLIL